jgi:hypothetical protein
MNDMVTLCALHQTISPSRTPQHWKQYMAISRDLPKAPFTKISSTFWIDFTVPGKLTRIGYLPFHQVEPVLFNTRSTETHQRKRRYMSPAFSAKNLNEYEPYMAVQIQKLVECIRRMNNSGETQLDFNEYGKYARYRPRTTPK